MNNTHPCIKVCDIETTIQWYVDFLGFQCTYKSSIKEPDIALLEKDDSKIYITKNENREAYASNIIIIGTDDIEAEYQSIEESGVIITQPIETGVFSEKEFVIKDYEDNKIVYVQRT